MNKSVDLGLIWAVPVMTGLDTPIKSPLSKREAGGVRLETSMSLFGSEKSITGLTLLVCARTTEGYGSNEFEISNYDFSSIPPAIHPCALTCYE